MKKFVAGYFIVIALMSPAWPGAGGVGGPGGGGVSGMLSNIRRMLLDIQLFGTLVGQFSLSPH